MTKQERDIAAVMVTVDRHPSPNYLGQTLDNLMRARVFASPRLHSFWLANSRLDSFAIAEILARDVNAYVSVPPEGQRTANKNVATALRLGAVAPWVLFLEDDIDVIDKFIENVGAWLDDHADEHLVYAFGMPYAYVTTLQQQGHTSCDYPVDQFYGTQALAMRAQDALDLAVWLDLHEFDRTGNGTAYDISMHDWAASKGVTKFKASVPSFIQHIGKSSVIAPRPESEIHTFHSWPGHKWFYPRKLRLV